MDRVINEKKRDKENIFAWLLAIIYFVPNINYYISFILDSLGLATTTVPLYIGVYLVVIFAYFRALFKNMMPIWSLAVVACLYLITLAFWPQNESFMFGEMWDAVYNPLYRIIFLGLPLFFLPKCIDNISYLYKVFSGFAWINLSVAMIAFFWQVIGAERDFEYMTFSYNLLFSACFCFMDSRKRKSLILTIVSVVSLFSVMVIGSRGSMLSVLIFIFLYTFMNVNRVSPIALITSRLILIIIAIFVIFDFRDIVTVIIDFFDSLGFESRTFEKILEENIFEDNSRTGIYNVIKEAIWDSPFFGKGLFGDRYAMLVYAHNATYTHNILLELLCHYGVLAGGILCILYLFNTIKALFQRKGSSFDVIYLCVFSATFLRLMFSSSYLSEPSFFLLIGFVSAMHNQRVELERL